MADKHNPAHSHRLLMGVMIVTAFLSMWISNSASTAMMLPITNAILEQLKVIEMQIEEEHPNTPVDNLSFEPDAPQIQQESSEKEAPRLEDRAGEYGNIMCRGSWMFNDLIFAPSCSG